MTNHRPKYTVTVKVDSAYGSGLIEIADIQDNDLALEVLNRIQDQESLEKEQEAPDSPRCRVDQMGLNEEPLL